MSAAAPSWACKRPAAPALKRFVAAITILVSLGSTIAQSQEERRCVTIGDLKGYSAYSVAQYEFSPDGFTNAEPRMFCYAGTVGAFANMEFEYGEGEAGFFVRLAADIWAWSGINTVELWMFDWSSKKATLSRVRSRGSALLPSSAGAFVGDIIEWSDL